MISAMQEVPGQFIKHLDQQNPDSA